ncbi:MAG: hypothetical protein QXP59_08175 [Saccharolobus sp.]
MEVMREVENTSQTPQQVGDKEDKLKEYIKDLEELTLGYDIKYIAGSIEVSYKVSDGAKEALKEVYNALMNYYQDAKTYGKLLSKNYNDGATRGMLINAMELYSRLKAIIALQKFIRSYNLRIEPDFVSPTFLDFMSKTKDVLIITISKYTNNMSERRKKELIENMIRKLSEAGLHVVDFKKEFREYKEQFEEREDLTVGEYRVLAKALKLMKDNYMQAIKFIRNTRAMIRIETKTGKSDVKKITWKTVEAYTLTRVPLAFYKILCNYDMCFTWYLGGFTGPYANLKTAIDCYL